MHQTYMISHKLNYIQVKFGVNPFISFEVKSQSVIVYGWLILIILHLLAYVTSNNLMHLVGVAESSQLFTNVMTDTQTHTHTQTNRVIRSKTKYLFRHKYSDIGYIYDSVFIINM